MFKHCDSIRPKPLPFVCLLAICCAESSHAQDASTLLQLAFDGSLQGAQGETPTAASGISYVLGIANQAAVFPAPNNLTYSAIQNINDQEGTLEFWINPSWNGDDGNSHAVLQHGVAGGMLFLKDGGNYLRGVFNRFGANGQPEMGVGLHVGDWLANDWHYVAFTWSQSAGLIRIYVDGQLRGTQALSSQLPNVNAPTLQIGGDGPGLYLEATLDELRVSDRERTPTEIAQRFLSALTIQSITIDPQTLTLLETWTRLPILTADTNLGPLFVPASAASWSSSNPAVATVDLSGTIHALSAGMTTITAHLNGTMDTLLLTVIAPVRQPEVDPLDPYLTTLPSCYRYEMPVAVIRYIPTSDGVTVNGTVSGFTGTVDQLKSYTDQLTLETKFMLQEGSRFRDYSAGTVPPSLGYRIVTMISVYEELPPDMNPLHSVGTPGLYFPDYNQILNRFGIEKWINDLGVKEIWLWGYHHGNIVPVESNMSSPTTGDISNSYRFQEDLPVLDHTYVLYNYNFTRSSNESVHNHGHQLEAILSHVNQLQEGSTDLFWRDFVGQDGFGNFITGRCGWTHMPPNTTSHYDYWNTTTVSSDIEDWTPDGSGATNPVNASTWASIPYDWPNGPPEDITQHQWYIYWMQSMPGWGNQIRLGDDYFADWWKFTGDWDAHVAQVSPSNGLYAASRDGDPLADCLGTAPVPATSTWGLCVLGLCIVVFATLHLGKRGFTTEQLSRSV